jgi:hypothetical protein
MLLAELEVRHSRAIAPTRRVALGTHYLPAQPEPGFGPLLLGAILGTLVGALDDELRDDLDRLLSDLEGGRRIAQPRLRHRFQTDVVGLARSHHQLVRVGGRAVLHVEDRGGHLPQVLGALYAATTLEPAVRPTAFRLLRRATRWEGEGDERLLSYLAREGTTPRPVASPGDEAWALGVLGLPAGSEPLRSDILRRFRRLVREVHPDHGGLAAEAGTRIQELADAKRVLLAGA